MKKNTLFGKGEPERVRVELKVPIIIGSRKSDSP
jgi:hypothetical protein